MKKLSLLFLAGMLFLVGSARAQLQKGTMHWGAAIAADGSLSHSKVLPNVDYKANAHNLSPSIQTGWMFKDNKMFGLRLGSTLTFGKTTSGLADQLEYTNTLGSLTLSPFVRHYKMINSKLAIFLQTGAEGTYYWSKSKSPDDSNHDSGFGAGLYLLPGITYFVSPRFAIESDLSLLSLGVSYSDFANWKNFNFNAGIRSSIDSYFGIRASWYLQKSN